jgi:hypothetical protein
VVGRTTEDPFAEQDAGVVRGEQVLVLRSQALGGEEQPVRQEGPAARDDVHLALPVAAGLLDQHPEVAARRGPDDLVGELGEVVLTQLRHRELDHPCLPRPQTARGEVGAVAELVDRPLHATPGLDADVRVRMHHVRHGLVRDAGKAGDVLQPHVHGRPLALLADVDAHARSGQTLQA